MIQEFAYLALLFVSGAIALRAFGASPAASACLGYLAGISIYVVWGTLQLVTPAPTTPFLTMALTVATAGGLAVWKRDDLSDGRKTILYLAAGLAVITAAVVLLRYLHLVKWHTDSFRYISIGALISNGNFHEVSSGFLRLRFPAMPLLHAPANLWDEFYVRALTPLLAVSILTSISWMFLTSRVAKMSGSAKLVFLFLALTLLVSTNRFVWGAFYLNGHLLFAALFLLIAGLGWLIDGASERSLRSLIFLQGIAIPALVMTRPEGFIAAGLALAPTLLSARLEWRTRAALLAAVGIATCIWHGFIIHRSGGVGVDVVRLYVLPAFALGALCIVFTPALAWKGLVRRRLALLSIAEVCFWGGLALLAFIDAEKFAANAAAIRHNLGGSGAWGYMPIFLFAIVTFSAVFCREPGLALLRFPLAASAVFYVSLGFMRTVPFRVGEGDTLNRMFIQLVPLAILLIAAAAASDRWSLLPGVVKSRLGSMRLLAPFRQARPRATQESP